MADDFRSLRRRKLQSGIVKLFYKLRCQGQLLIRPKIQLRRNLSVHIGEDFSSVFIDAEQTRDAIKRDGFKVSKHRMDEHAIVCKAVDELCRLL